MIELYVADESPVLLELSQDGPIELEVLEQIGGGSGALSDEAKQALLQIASKVAYIDDGGQTYYNALYNALYPSASLVSISAVYTQSSTVYESTSLNSLKTDLVVTALYDDTSTETIPSTDYTLSGTLSVGTSTVTVTYQGKTTTFNVTVSATPTVSSISAVYTQSGTVYDTDSLDSLKSDLVVTATLTDSSTMVVPSADYTLSGTLTAGTSTITVTFSSKTTTFTVTVTASAPTVVSITAVYTQSGTVYDTDSLDSLKTDLVVTATWSDTSTTTVASNDYTLSGALTVGTSTITATYEGKTDSFSVTVTMSRATRFGTFIAGYSLGKKMKSGQGAPTMALYSVWNNAASARAAITAPIANNGYTLTVTDSTKYNLAIYGITDPTANDTDYVNAVTGKYFQGDSATPSFAASQSTNESYLMISLKKIDNTEFTSAELSNGAEAVFTFTESS